MTSGVVDTASPFFSHLRQTIASAGRYQPPLGPRGGVLSVSDIQARLQQLATRSSGPQRGPDLMPAIPPAAPTNSTVQLVGTQPSTSTAVRIDLAQPRKSDSELPSLPGNGPAPRPELSPLAPAPTSRPGSDDVAGSGWSSAEVDTMRVIELDVRFRISASVNEGPMTTLCSDASVKVFPRHVVFSTTSEGGQQPVVEIVILELFELAEDDVKETLVFHLQRVSGTAVVEAASPVIAARSCLYKLVCAKRNALERQRQDSVAAAPPNRRAQHPPPMPGSTTPAAGRPASFMSLMA